MKEKHNIVKKYIYEGLGFPIELHDVVFIAYEGEWCPKIDIEKIAYEAIIRLSTSDGRLTGNQVKFIRSYFSMNLRDFAKLVEVSHTAVNKWEHCKDNVTAMDINIEKMLRLFIVDKLAEKEQVKKNKIYEAYLLLKGISVKSKPIRLLMDAESSKDIRKLGGKVEISPDYDHKKLRGA